MSRNDLKIEAGTINAFGTALVRLIGDLDRAGIVSSHAFADRLEDIIRGSARTTDPIEARDLLILENLAKRLRGGGQGGAAPWTPVVIPGGATDAQDPDSSDP